MASSGLNLPYHGPMSLRSSKYAVENANPAITPTKPYGLSALVARPENGKVANKEQLATSADLQLAFAQNEALKKEVEEHAATFSQSVNSAVTNTRQLLQLLRESIAVKPEDNAAKDQLKTVDGLGEELERLYKTAQEAKKALPDFLEKQGDNMKLYHNSALAETITETQQELTLQHKKIAIQQDLILEKQQAFADYKSRTDAQVKQLADLEKQVSRLTLENGLLRTELDKDRKETNLLKAAQEDQSKAVTHLQNEMQTAINTKRELSAENERLRASIGELQQGVQHAGGLEAQLKELQSKGATQKRDLEQAVHATAELDALHKKYKQLSAEYSAIFTKSNEQSKVVEELTKEKNELANALKEATTKSKTLQEECNKLQPQFNDLTASMEAAKGQIGTLNNQLEEARTTAQTEKDGYKSKLSKLEKELDELDIDHNNALAEAAAHKKAAPGMKALQEENASLYSIMKELREKQARPATSSDSSLQEKIRSLELELAKMAPLVSKASEWRNLAEKSYAQYKEILPTYKEAERIRQASAAKDNQISQLTEQLKKSSASTGASGGANVEYWKKKYDMLLASLT